MYFELKSIEGLTDASGAKTATDASGAKTATDASGAKTATDASGAKTATSSSSSSTDIKNIFQQVFTKSNIVIFFWFLAIYIALSFLVSLFNPNAQASMASKAIDFILLAGILAFVIISYYSKSVDEKKAFLDDIYTKIKNYVNDTVSVISLGLFLFVFYLTIYMISIPMNRESKPISIMIIENGVWIMFILSLITTFFNQVLGIKLTDYIDELFGKIEKVSTPNNKSTGDKSTTQDEVFNISSNRFTYQDAQSVCKVYGARLATYDEIEKAYNKGGEWCNYGWSENQSIYFPTQKSTWDELQKQKGHENECGRPGVNGGYIANPNLRFGVNCYGKRPAASKKDTDFMKANSSAVRIKSRDEEIVDKKVKFWKDNQERLLRLNSFNRTKWSEY